MRAHLDTSTTILYICKALSKFHTKICLLDVNISKFNVYLGSSHCPWCLRWTYRWPFLVHIFKGYHMAQDSDFCDFIKCKKDAYDDGVDITISALMEITSTTQSIFHCRATLAGIMSILFLASMCHKWHQEQWWCLLLYYRMWKGFKIQLLKEWTLPWGTTQGERGCFLPSDTFALSFIQKRMHSGTLKTFWNYKFWPVLAILCCY